MKITYILAAGLMAAGLGMSTAANAQDYRGDRHSDHRGDDRGDRRYDHNDRRYDRGDRHYNRGRYDRGSRYYGRRCRTEYRHHRRVRICR